MAATAGCRHASTCGGCPWQHVPYPDQLRRKRDALQALIAAHVRSAPDVGLGQPMPVGDDGMPWHFRHKAAFVFGPAGRGRFVMGHFAPGGREIVPVEECPVHSDRANRIAFRLRDELARARVSAAGPDLAGVLRHVIVRTSADERDAVAMLVVTRNAPELKRPIRALLASEDRPDGCFLNVHDTPSPYMVGKETLRLDGHSHVRERIAGTTFLVSPTAFFQTNPTAAAQLVELVLSAIDPAMSSVLDVYAGSGLFSLPLARRGHRVTAVEENRWAVADAQRNLTVNRVDARAVRLVAGRAETALPALSGQRFDAVVLDPPRQGCAPGVLRVVFQDLRPARAVYVSCGPESFAHELPGILAAGYRLSSVHAVDMFPHTPHAEAVAVLDRIDSSAPRPRTRDNRS